MYINGNLISSELHVPQVKIMLEKPGYVLTDGPGWKEARPSLCVEHTRLARAVAQAGQMTALCGTSDRDCVLLDCKLFRHSWQFSLTYQYQTLVLG